MLLLLVGFDLGASDIAEYSYLFPVPESRHHSPNTPIVLRFKAAEPTTLTNLESFLEVKGELSGIHQLSINIASDQKTIIAKSSKPFSIGEQVHVELSPAFTTGGGIHRSYSFEISEGILDPPTALQIDRNRSDLAQPSSLRSTGSARIMPNGVSVPSDFPHVIVTVSDNPDSGYIYMNNWGPPNYNTIFDNEGNPAWYQRTWDTRRDFKLQPNGWQTMLVRDGYGGSGAGYIALDENFNYIKSFRATAGYGTDEHELQVFPDSGYMLIGWKRDIVDMSQYVIGGDPEAVVVETCFQVFTKQDELIFIWRAWDHFNIRDLDLESLYEGTIRFPHMNALDLDEDGHYLLSSRHLSEVSKIHSQSGQFIWRLVGVPGAETNDFEFVDDPLNGFRNQHDIRSMGAGRYTIFDNGNLHEPATSRSIEYQLDTTEMTATLIWSYEHDNSNVFSYYMGNSQRLPSGTTHINWARGDVMPIVTEVRPDGSKSFEMWLKEGYHCYRNFRFNWIGQSLEPYLLTEPLQKGFKLIYNKFGEEEVAYYRIYGSGTNPPSTLIDTSHSTMKALMDLENNELYHFGVTAVSMDGIESPMSNIESVFTNFVDAGVNIIKNGAFDVDYENWTWELQSGGVANLEIEQGVAHFNIDHGGNDDWSVQLRQTGIPLIQESTYIFEFDAWADSTRFVTIKMEQDGYPYTNYSKIGFTVLTSTPQHFSHEFVMADPSDSNARVVINAGSSSTDIYVDNFSLELKPQVALNDTPQRPSNFILHPARPNPFNPSTMVFYDLHQSGFIAGSLYSIQGREMLRIDKGFEDEGQHAFELNGADLAAGVYFFVLNITSRDGIKQSSAVQKLTLIR